MKITRGVFRWRGWVAAGLTAWAGMAGAVNVVDTPPAQPLADQQLTIGARSLMLPPGNWSYIARSDGFVRHGGVDRKAPHHTAYAMNVNNGRMVAGVVLRLAINSTPVHDWNEEPCKVELALYKDELGGTVKFPECLVIYKRRSHMAAKQDGLYGAAREWAAAQPVKLPGPVYEIVYTRFGVNDFGWVRVFLPLQSVADDQEMIGWARQLPDAFRPLFENREPVTALPALPERRRN